MTHEETCIHIREGTKNRFAKLTEGADVDFDLCADCYFVWQLRQQWLTDDSKNYYTQYFDENGNDCWRPGAAGVDLPPISAPPRSFRRTEDGPELAIKAILVFGEIVNEGKIVEAVSVPWFEILKMLGKDSATAFQLTAEQWEEIVAGAYHRAGFEEVVLTRRSGDLGRDVIATKRGLGTIRIIDQVKAYKPGHLVTANDVRALVGVLHGDGASKGFLTTTSDFAPRIHTDPLLVPFMPSRLELINGLKLFQRLRDLAGQHEV